jgi:hypothetical protein
MKSKTLGIILGVLAVKAALSCYIVNYLADKEINKAVYGRQSRPKGWITLVPGKTDKYIDLYLKNLDSIYSNAKRPENKLAVDYLVNFSESYAPERLKEVNEKGVEFLISKGNLFEASWIAEFSGDKSLVKKVKKAKGKLK